MEIYDELIAGQTWYAMSVELIESEFGIAGEISVYHLRMGHRYNKRMNLCETAELVRSCKNDFYNSVIPLLVSKGVDLVYANPVPWMEKVLRRHGFIEIKKGEFYLDI